VVALFSVNDGVKAQAPAGAGPSIAPQSRRVHPLVSTDSTPAGGPQGPSDSSPVVMSGSWQAVTTPPAAIDNCLLLTDGGVMCHGYGTRNWYKLRPTTSGSYVGGTWTTLAPMQSGYAPIYFSSAVLPDGRVIVEGGEYNCNPGCTANWQKQGSIYDPTTNAWTPVLPPSGWTSIGDASAVVLTDGTYFQSSCCSGSTAVLNLASLTWTVWGSGKLDNYNDEESWTFLPNGKILTVDVWPAGSLKSEWFDPTTAHWSFVSNTPVSLADNANDGVSHSYEIGAGVLRPNGTVFAIGANPNQTATCCTGFAHTAIFDSVLGAWSAGPDIPNHDGANDAPAAVLPNGNVLFTAAPPASTSNVWTTPTRFYEFDGTSITQVASPTYCSPACNFVVYPGGMLVLPTGQVLYTKQSSQVQVYTPSGSADPSWMPTISAVPAVLAPGQTYQISGTQFNGLTQGAYYGDDQQSATNYPLVRLTNRATGHIVYARTHGHSSMGLATGAAAISTSFDVPASVELGSTDVEVVANGIASAKTTVSISSGNPAPIVSAIAPTTGTTAGGTSVTISGSNFAAGATVSIGGVAAPVATLTPTSITATTGAHAAGVVNVVVTNPDTQTGTLNNGFTYVAPPPSVTGVTPGSGTTSGGTAITISGSNFVAGATVTLGGTPATGVSVVNAFTINATTPAHAAGAVDVVVTNPDGRSGTKSSGFTYTATPPPPTVTSVSPGAGSTTGGTNVTVTGSNFVSGATLTFGGAAATQVVFVNATTITATTPAHAPGSVNVVVTNPDGQVGTLVNGFNYKRGKH
jgi:hypothetical protein